MSIFRRLYLPDATHQGRLRSNRTMRPGRNPPGSATILPPTQRGRRVPSAKEDREGLSNRGVGAPIGAGLTARPDRPSEQPGTSPGWDLCRPHPHLRLHERRGESDPAERGRGVERLPRSPGAGPGAGWRRAQPNAIEEASGHLVGDGFRPEAVTEALREVIRGGGQARQRYGWTPSRPALQMSRRVIEAREQRRHAR